MYKKAHLVILFTIILSVMGTCAVPAMADVPGVAPWTIHRWPEAAAHEPIELMQGSVQVMTMELTPSSPQPRSDFKLVLTVPAGVSVIDPSRGRLPLASLSDGKPWSMPFYYFTPRHFQSVSLPDGGHRYVMADFPEFRKGSGVNVLSLTFVLSDTLESGTFHYELKGMNDQWTSDSMDAPFKATPRISVPVTDQQITAAPDVIYLPGASQAEWNAILGFWNQIGINQIWVRPRSHYPGLRERNIQFAEFVRKKFPHIKLGYWMPWIEPYTPYNNVSMDFVKAHPQAAGVGAPGNALADQAKGKLLSNEYLTNYPNDYFDEALVPNLKLAERSGISTIVWDAEKLNPWAYSYAPADLKAFRAYAHLSDQIELTPEIIRNKYKEQWLSFRLDQNWRIAKVYAKYVRAITPKAKFAIYSGWAIPDTVDRYGIQWSEVAPLADVVIAGPEGRAARVSMTHRLIQKVSPDTQLLFNIQGVKSWDRGFYPPPQLTYAKAMAAFANGGQGYLLWWWGGVIGSQWSQVARANRFAWKFNDILSQPDEMKPLQWVENIAGAFRVRRGDKTFIICANTTKSKITLEPLEKTNGTISDSAVVFDETSGRIVAPAVLSQPIPLESGQVQVYCIGPGSWIESVIHK
jgi:hypothetical protein